jgi:hypothetical protein
MMMGTLGWVTGQRVYCDHSSFIQMRAEFVTKKLIRKLPELPNARLYLDDLFEIEALLVEEYGKLPDNPSISFEYEIDNDLVVTTHEELIEHEGHTSIFQLNIKSSEWRFRETRVLVLYKILHPQFIVPNALRERGANIRENVRQIFETRADNFRNFAEKIPNYVYTFPVAIALAVFTIVSLVNRTLSHESLYWTIVMALSLPLAVAQTGDLRCSRINFRHARQDANARKKVRNERIEKLLLVLAGAVVATIGKFILDKLTH